MARAKDVEGSAKVPLPEPFLSFHKHPNSLDGDNDNCDDDDGSAGGEDEDEFDEEKDDHVKDGDGPFLMVVMMLIRDALPHLSFIRQFFFDIVHQAVESPPSLEHLECTFI